MLPAFIKRKDLPHKPGVYLFRDKGGKIIYVGKAIDLYHRVSSYFSGWKDGVKLSHSRGDIRTHSMVNQITFVETIIVESELEALILEANLIKKYLPEFNVSLKDDKDYLYIKITKEKFPRVVTSRKHGLPAGRQGLAGSLKYFGPFPSSRTVRETLKALRRVFPWCSLPPRRGSTSLKACFYYHLGLCPGSCAGVISKEEYSKNIRRLIKLLDGKKEQLIGELAKEMENEAKIENFEEAGKIKKTINGIIYLTQSNRTQVYLENSNFLQDQRLLALQNLQKVLNLPEIPSRIEGYDISNIGGRQAVGSMVVLTDGEIDKSQYRKFKIHISGKPNDVGMHKEMMRRRLRHKEWNLPDLMVIDGGLGQVNGVVAEIKSVRGFRGVRVYGLAKRMEWVYSADGNIIKLPKSSPALHILQKLRDEAHRFAITYHRKLRGKSFLLN